MISIVIPVYNEKNTIETIIRKVHSLGFDKEIIVVDDGSTDGTKDVLERLDIVGLKKAFLTKNGGKGTALRKGFELVTGDIVAVQDADTEYDPQEIQALAEPILRGMADVVYGSRLSGGKPQRVYMFWHLVGNKMLTLFANILYNSTLSDMESCYKVFRSSVLKDMTLRSKRFEIEVELTAKFCKNKYRIYEMPISYYGRTYREGKKIRWTDGFSALWALLRYRFSN